MALASKSVCIATAGTLDPWVQVRSLQPRTRLSKVFTWEFSRTIEEKRVKPLKTAFVGNLCSDGAILAGKRGEERLSGKILCSSDF